MAVHYVHRMARRYELKERARAQEATRQRIVDATVALHREVGPARTTIAEIARRAGVGRVTVYNHFPDETALLGACSAQCVAENPPPDPGAWAAIENPAKRLRDGARGALRATSAPTRRCSPTSRATPPLVPALAEVLGDRAPASTSAPCARRCSPAACCAAAGPPDARRGRARARLLHLAAPDPRRGPRGLRRREADGQGDRIALSAGQAAWRAASRTAARRSSAACRGG